jgi:hypothetical protein
LAIDPFFADLRGDDRFISILTRLDALNAEMYERVLEAESTGDWAPLIALAGST